jgi:hypothetical protein
MQILNFSQRSGQRHVCCRVTSCRLTVTDVSGKPNTSIFRIKQSNACTFKECVSPKFRNCLPVDRMSLNTCIFIYYPNLTYYYYYYYYYVLQQPLCCGFTYGRYNNFFLSETSRLAPGPTRPHWIQEEFIWCKD